MRRSTDAIGAPDPHDRNVGYAISRRTPLGFAEALDRAREALAVEGFGVLGEIDVQETLRQKLGEEIGPYRILGACNPPLAHRALSEEPQLGVLLPCNVVVRVEDDATLVEAIDPEEAFAIVDSAALEPVAAEVRERLVRVVEAVAS